jgi:hypothetical protein
VYYRYAAPSKNPERDARRLLGKPVDPEALEYVRLVNRAADQEEEVEMAGVEPKEPKGRCNRCKRMKPFDALHYVSRFGGGNWQRGGRWNKASICLDCVKELLNHLQEGHGSVENYGSVGLKMAFLAGEKKIAKAGVPVK